MPALTKLSNRPRLFNVLHKLGLVQPVSQTAPAERGAICRHLKGCEIAIEIGTFMGVTAAEMAQELPKHGKLYCIDPYPHGDSLLAIAQRHIGREGMADRVTILRCDSSNASAMLPAGVDLAFVDGDHSYEGLREDWALVRRVLRVGGIVAFHDTAHVEGAGAQSKGAIRFYDEVISKDSQFKFVECILSLNIVRRTA